MPKKQCNYGPFCKIKDKCTFEHNDCPNDGQCPLTFNNGKTLCNFNHVEQDNPTLEMFQANQKQFQVTKKKLESPAKLITNQQASPTSRIKTPRVIGAMYKGAADERANAAMMGIKPITLAEALEMIRTLNEKCNQLRQQLAESQQELLSMRLAITMKK